MFVVDFIYLKRMLNSFNLCAMKIFYIFLCSGTNLKYIKILCKMYYYKRKLLNQNSLN